MPTGAAGRNGTDRPPGPAMAADCAEAPAGIRQVIARARAAHGALVERDPALVEAWLGHTDGGLYDLSASRRWLAAQAAALRGDLDSARVAIAEARAALGRVQDPPSTRCWSKRSMRLSGGARLRSERRYSTR